MYCIQHCFIGRPSDSTVSEDAGINIRSVAPSALALTRSISSINILLFSCKLTFVHAPQLLLTTATGREKRESGNRWGGGGGGYREPVFLNVYGAHESIPRNECLCSLAGRYDNPIPARCLAPIDC
jgi:hypothetical protein